MERGQRAEVMKKGRLRTSIPSTSMSVERVFANDSLFIYPSLLYCIAMDGFSILIQERL